MTMGEYEVTGRREYRGHPHGEIFEARLSRSAESRAIARGDIRLLRVIEPTIQPAHLTLSAGWLSNRGKE